MQALPLQGWVMIHRYRLIPEHHATYGLARRGRALPSPILDVGRALQAAGYGRVVGWIVGIVLGRVRRSAATS
jgi:hypothetical protein